MAKDFGNTWWGSEWLRSLTNIDYENRIPRGARYARNGAVRKITVSSGESWIGKLSNKELREIFD